MRNVTRLVLPGNTVAGRAMHASLVVLGVAAAMLVAYSPAPAIGLLVLAVVLGVEIPIAVGNFLGVVIRPA